MQGKKYMKLIHGINFIQYDPLDVGLNIFFLNSL